MKYRERIYGDYFSNQVNKKNVDYQRLIDIQKRQLHRDIVPFLPSNKNAKIVDIGCGYGSMIYTANKAGYTNASGIDLSEEQVKIAHELGMTQVREMSINDWSNSGEKADCILAIDLIEHLTKDELIAFLDTAKSALNKDGVLILRTPNMDAPQTSIYAHGDFSHEVFLNKSSALQLMSSIGFGSVQVKGGIIHNQKPTNLLRSIMWSLMKFKLKLELWITGRQWNEVVFEPNLVIIAR